MAVTVRIESIAKDIDVLVGGLKSDASAQLLAQFAADEIADAKANNASVLGRVPPYKVYVDGRQGADLGSVRPDGVIVAEFELISTVLIWISQQLTQYSPVKSGRYQRSHTLFADGRHVEQVTAVPVADEYVFVNTVPYARKIERGASSQAPDGVYQAVAALARQQFREMARSVFAFRTLPGGLRNPAIVVTPNK